MSRLTERYVQTVAEAAGKDRNERFKVVAATLGGLAFFVIVPAILFGLGYLLYEHCVLPYAHTIRVVAAWIAILGGLLIFGWTFFSLADIGKGTPVPLAPPRKLIVTGPYRYCRNPMQLGALIYYFGLGTLLNSIWVGMLMFIIGLILGSLFHKLFEEPELERRFGSDYAEYRAGTPFIFPKLGL